MKRLDILGTLIRPSQKIDQEHQHDCANRDEGKYGVKSHYFN